MTADTKHKTIWERLSSLLTMRLGIVILIMLGCFCGVSMRTNLGMAMVCMVNASAFAPQLSPHHFNRSQPEFQIQKEEPICIREQNDEFSVEDVGYHGELLWSPSMQSTLFSATFYGGIVTMIPAGYLADRFGSKVILLATIMDYSVITLLTPLLVNLNYYAFLVARVIMGLGEGFLLSGMSALAAHWIPASERSAMAALYTSGNQLSGCLGVAISSRLCAATEIGGWRSIFYFFGILGIFWAIVWCIVVTNSPSQNRWISEKEKTYLQLHIKEVNNKKQLSPKAVPWKKILFAPCMLASYFSQFAFGFQLTMMQSYLPAYFRDVILLKLSSNGLFTAMPFLTSLICKNVIGTLSDRLKKANILSPTSACKAFQCIAAFGCAATLVGIGLFVDCHRPMLALVFLCLLGFCMSSAIVGFFTSQLSVAPCYTGTIVSVGMATGTIGNILSPNVIGKLILHNGTPKEWTAVFLLSAALQFASGIVFVIFGSADEQPWASSGAEVPNGNCECATVGHTNVLVPDDCSLEVTANGKHFDVSAPQRTTSQKSPESSPEKSVAETTTPDRTTPNPV